MLMGNAMSYRQNRLNLISLPWSNFFLEQYSAMNFWLKNIELSAVRQSTAAIHQYVQV